MKEIKFMIYYRNFHPNKIEIAHRVIILGQPIPRLGKFWQVIGKCQYTGLKDKNGKEIYEGDVLTGWQGEQQDEPEKRWRVKDVVIFRNGSFKVFGHPLCDSLFIPEDRRAELTWCQHGYMNIPNIYYGIYDIEIIGNIYENPELVDDNPEDEGPD